MTGMALGGRVTLERHPLGAVDAVTVLSVFILILCVLPARFVLGALGAAGTPAGIVAVLCLAWYLASMITPRTTPIHGRQPVRGLVVFFCCAILASYVATMGRALSGSEVNGADRGLILTMGWAGLALLAADGIGRLDRLEKIRRRLVTGGGFIAFLGIVQFFTRLDLATYLALPGLTSNSTGPSVLNRDGFNRPMSTASHPIEFGVVMAMLLPLALHGVIHAEPGKRGRRWIPVVLILTALPMTVSRSAILGLLVVGLCLLPIWPTMLRLASVMVVGVTMVFVHAAIPGLLGSITGLVTSFSSDTSTVSRTNAYGVVAQAVSERPWFGLGFGTYDPHVHRYLDNQYMGSLIETGLIGTAALIAILLSGWVLARRARRATTDPELRHMAQCFAASSMVALVSFGTFDALGFPMVANLAFLIIGCCGALWRLTRETGATRATVRG